MPNDLRLRTLSGFLYWVALVLSVVLPIIVLLFAAKGVTQPVSLLSRTAVPAGTPVSTTQAGLVAAVALISVLPMVAALRGMVRLFAAYREGDVLNEANANTILRIGRNLLLVAILTVVVPTLQTLILSWEAAQKMLSIALDGSTFGFLMAAGLLTVIGYAMGEAARVKVENEGFV